MGISGSDKRRVEDDKWGVTKSRRDIRKTTALLNDP